MDFGIVADAQAAPDVQLLARAIALAFDDLRLLEVHPPTLAHEQENAHTNAESSLISLETAVRPRSPCGKLALACVCCDLADSPDG